MSPRLFTLLGVLLAAVTACEPSAPAPQPAAARPAEGRRYFGAPPDGKLHVYFFDVGMGDAALIVSPDGKTVLVDSGPASAANHLVNRLPELLRKPLDLIVLTHAHDDHYGALGPVIRRVGAKRLLEPRADDTPSDYQALLSNLDAQKVERISPLPLGSETAPPLRLGDGVELTVLWPRTPDEPLLDVSGAGAEANSLVLRLTHGDTSILFAADAHARTVAHLLERKLPLKATLLKVPAHGAEGPTTQALLDAVRPRAALISVGRDRAGAADGTRKRLDAAGAHVFSTDVDGEVQVVGDGKTLVITPQRLPENAPHDTAYTFAAEGPSATAQPPKVEAALQPPKPELAQAVPPKTPQGTGAADKPPAPQQQVDIDISESAAARAARLDPLTNPDAPAARGSTVYVASAKRELFHVLWCPAAKQIKTANRVMFKSREEASKTHTAHSCVP